MNEFEEKKQEMEEEKLDEAEMTNVAGGRGVASKEELTAEEKEEYRIWLKAHREQLKDWQGL